MTHSSPCVLQVYEDVSQCCQALSQRLGTQPYFFNKQYVLRLIYIEYFLSCMSVRSSSELRVLEIKSSQVLL